ncbi:MAG: hypothetical protein C4297_00575 [Gemmataceae bacterium]
MPQQKEPAVSQPQFEVVIVGGGCAGLSAAIGLARAGVATAVVEAAPYPGAENWSGCVYFCESLASEELVGEDLLARLAWERRLVERGFFVSDGQSLLGMTYRHPPAFKHCYTVLRPVFDHHLAQVARAAGVTLFCNTTVESLAYERDPALGRGARRVVGVVTQRGPIYGRLTFLAEGDASHLVAREGYETHRDERGQVQVHFLHGIKEVIELPAGAIEERFGLGPEEGAAYEILLRNGSFRGRPVHLNAGAFLYTNRHSVSLGLVLPAAHLASEFAGDPHLLLEWLEGLPAMQPWLRDGKRTVFGAKLIRGGGARDIPRLIDHGLAIGGAASAVGIDFPYPNFTGPATFMGLQLVRAVRAIREQRGSYTYEELRRHYLEPLQRSHFWRDVEFLRDWPAFVHQARFFFGRNLDLALASAWVWTQPGKRTWHRLVTWAQIVPNIAGPRHWRQMRTELGHLAHALRVPRLLRQVRWLPLLGLSCVNFLRDVLYRRPPPSDAGTVEAVYRRAGDRPEAPRWLARWFARRQPTLARAAKYVYENNTSPLEEKLRRALRLVVYSVSLGDIARAALGAAFLSLVGFMAWWRTRKKGPATEQTPAVHSTTLATPNDSAARSQSRPGRAVASAIADYIQYARTARQVTDMTPVAARALTHWEDRLGRLQYWTGRSSHIRLLWPLNIATRRAIQKIGLWHVCPAHVYEARVNDVGELQVVVNYENCIKCETCWRTVPEVDWGRDGQHRIVYPVSTVAARRLWDTQPSPEARSQLLWSADGQHPTGIVAASVTRAQLALGPAVAQHPAQEKDQDRTACGYQMPAAGAQAPSAADAGGQPLLKALHCKLRQLEEAVVAEPRTVDAWRKEYVRRLAIHASRMLEDFSRSWHAMLADHEQAQAYLELARSKVEQLLEHVEQSRLSWAAADARWLRWHALPQLEKHWSSVGSKQPTAEPLTSLSVAEIWSPWKDAEAVAQVVQRRAAALRVQLQTVCDPLFWRSYENTGELSPEQRRLLAVMMKSAGLMTSGADEAERAALLAELAALDPALGYALASRWWAADLVAVSENGSWAQFFEAADCLAWPVGAYAAAPAERLQLDKDAAAIWPEADAEDPAAHRTSTRHAWLVPEAPRYFLVVREGVVPIAAPHGASDGWSVEPLETMGLRGARPQLVRLDLERSRSDLHPLDALAYWRRRACLDLVYAALGMTRKLLERCIEHARIRVQFPGLFLDEEARDGIGKFGAVKQMLAEMELARALLETGAFFVPRLLPDETIARLCKAHAAEWLGTAPGSVTYNAGQIFGGTGYSEDDILAKFYRDAAAFRYLVAENASVWVAHGRRMLLRSRRGEALLTPLPYESDVFELLSQRGVLTQELERVRQLRERIVTWVAAHTRATALPGHALEQLGWLDGALLLAKAFLVRIAALQENARDAESLEYLAPVWLQRIEERVQRLEIERRTALPALGQLDRSAQPPDAGSREPRVVATYAELLSADMPYQSGDFLLLPEARRAPRLVPEMIQADPELAAVDRQYQELLQSFFGARHGSDRPYERIIEERHRPDAEELAFCRKHGFFRMPIPSELGGEGKRKVDYYLLVTHAQRLADVSVSLAIQASTSIGTTPILIARDRDLPRAQRDVQAFFQAADLRHTIWSHLHTLRQALLEPDPARLQTLFQRAHEVLQREVFGNGTLRSIGHALVQAWRRAARAGQDYDLPRFVQAVEQACAAWADLCDSLPMWLDELGRRREACDLFLRWIASGQISAFALTEPSAGSDTARVATRAVRRSVPLTPEPDGSYRFEPATGTGWRRLLDARRLIFQGDTVYYRWHDDSPPAPLCFDEYDYETDDPSRQRYYLAAGHKVYFTDIAQIRERDGCLWYDYWEVTGAKMWITNGRIAGVMCLYARTEQGVTGFMVDRHAEGLVVGKDEAKMGQRGSPTNELSLQAVRVPLENVLGLEGRGQVNALETLNVGRAGLAVSAVAQMPGLEAMAEQALAASPPEQTACPQDSQPRRNDVLSTDGSGWHVQETAPHATDLYQARIHRMRVLRVIAEALAFDMVGRFEHKQTRSVRMESAIAKMLVSELLHESIELAEDVCGPAGQTHRYLLEKRKRDARILNIYEGTNEVQRFFILKDLLSELAPRLGAEPGTHLARAAETGREQFRSWIAQLDELCQACVRCLAEAQTRLGAELWQNPNLQPDGFLLAEAIAWLKAADSVCARHAWLRRRLQAQSDPAEVVHTYRRTLDLLDEACALCLGEVERRLQAWGAALQRLEQGYYHPVIAAGARLLRSHAAARDIGMENRTEAPVRILTVLEPEWGAAPQPAVCDGELLDYYVAFTRSSMSALEQALRIRDAAPDRVSVYVACAMPPRGTHLARELLACGVHKVYMLVLPSDTVPPEQMACLLARRLRQEHEPIDVLVGGAGAGSQKHGCLTTALAGILRIPSAGVAEELVLTVTEQTRRLCLGRHGARRGDKPLPAFVALERDVPLRDFRIEAFQSADPGRVVLVDWPADEPIWPMRWLAGQEVAKDEQVPAVAHVGPEEAARLIRCALGLGPAEGTALPTDGSAVAAPWATEEVEDAQLLADAQAVAIVRADSAGRLGPGAQAAFSWIHALAQQPSSVWAWVFARQDEATWAHVAQALALAGIERALLVPTPAEMLDQTDWLLAMAQSLVLPRMPHARWVIAETWAESVLSRWREEHGGGLLALRLRQLDRGAGAEAIAVFGRGRLRCRHRLQASPGAPCWLGLAEDAQAIPYTPSAAAAGKWYVWRTALARWDVASMARLLEALRLESGVTRLADADFIIDVGYGIGNRDGYEQVIEPLEKALRALGVRGLAIGGSRKVTEELHLLPPDRQIGQSGQAVRPRILLAIGISGAPQHLNYIDPNTVIVAFNRDPEAPIMTLNRRQPRPRVYPVLGDLFETVPALVAALLAEAGAASRTP